jgi:uncharacterized protein
MTVEQALAELRRNRRRLNDLGVLHLAIFGSFARGEERPESDLDVLVSLDPDRRIDLFAYAGIELTLEEILGRRVDMANGERLKPHVRSSVERDAIYAF